MGFNPTNGARSITQALTQWKSRELNMSSRSRGTMNFGDICPLYWAFTLPQDKFKCDSRGVFKFMPLIAPAMVDCKVQFDWFWVPLKLIAPLFRQSLQNWSPSTLQELTKSISNPFDSTIGFKPGTITVHHPDSAERYEETTNVIPPQIPAWLLSSYLCSYPINLDNNGAIITPSDTSSHWRSDMPFDLSGMESYSDYSVMLRNSKLMGYMGLPKVLTTLKFNQNIAPFGTNVPEDLYVTPDGEFYSDVNYLTTDYLEFAQNGLLDANPPQVIGIRHKWPSGYKHDGALDVTNYLSLSILHKICPTSTINFQSAPNFTINNIVNYNMPLTNSTAPISLLPFQAYQTIYNKFYRDQKIMKEEIRTYVNFNIQQYPFSSADLSNYVSLMHYPFKVVSFKSGPGFFNMDKSFFNNLFGLRRKNYAKDLFSTAYPDSAVLINNQSDPLTSSNVSLLAKYRKFMLKKEMTGSDFFQWLNNFFGTRGADYLTDNVVHLGSHESQVMISENIQNSESTSDSAQGNRAGLANSYTNDREIYFESPDFGVLMCNVTLIPDFPTNYSGLDPRWSLVNPIDWNFVDLQNVGFTTLYNQNLVLGMFEKDEFLNYSGNKLFDKNTNDSAFGYQPFGYAWTYQPDIICGDMRSSLKFWHQSPDYNDFAHSNIESFTDNLYPKLNFNYPAIGRRFIPGNNKMKSYSSIYEEYYNNIFAVTNDQSGDHCVFDIKFDVTFHRKTAFFTDGLPETN